MKQITITKSGQVTNSAQFPSQEEADAWLAKHEGMGTFGIPAYTAQQQVEIFPAVIDEEGNEISPAQFETQDFQIPATYDVEITDISAQLEQQRINEQSLKYLAETDFIVVRAAERGEQLSPEFKAERAAARASIIR